MFHAYLNSVKRIVPVHKTYLSGALITRKVHQISAKTPVPQAIFRRKKNISDGPHTPRVVDGDLIAFRGLHRGTKHAKC